MSCKKTDIVDNGATIDSLLCAQTVYSAVPVSGVGFTGSVIVPYTGGNGRSYAAGALISSTGVTGLNAILQAGALANGVGKLNYTITGTPSAAGSASFDISFGGRSCSFSITINATGATTPTITSLNCESVVYSAIPVIAEAFTGTATVDYTGANGLIYPAGASIASTGVTGLTATLQGDTLGNGAGKLIYNISGTPASAGTATFALNFGGQSCSINLKISPVSLTCTNATTIANVIAKITAFKALLSATQLTSVQLDYTREKAVNWSNLACGATCRNGLLLSTLTPEQVTAALDIVAAATGTAANEGSDELKQIRLGDDYLNANGGGSGYASDIYSIAFLGNPSATGTWQLQFGGHNAAVNITYESNVVAGVTPMFEAIEPISFVTSGTTYAPLIEEQSAMKAMLASLTTTQLAAAKLTTNFGSLLLGPGRDGQFPKTKLGIQVSTLTSAQKALVLDAMKPWIKDADDATATCLLAIYENELDDTYISYSGNATLSINGDYVRIDGPSVWIEFLCQRGVVIVSQISYQSVWRDHLRDYGNNYIF